MAEHTEFHYRELYCKTADKFGPRKLTELNIMYKYVPLAFATREREETRWHAECVWIEREGFICTFRHVSHMAQGRRKYKTSDVLMLGEELRAP